jgi:hypothetical protein
MLYYESHITLEPVFADDPRRPWLEEVAQNQGFKIAKLLMRKRSTDVEQESRDDTFLTGHDQKRVRAYARTSECVLALKRAGFKVLRYKVEGCVVDSRTEDVWRLLE